MCAGCTGKITAARRLADAQQTLGWRGVCYTSRLPLVGGMWCGTSAGASRVRTPVDSSICTGDTPLSEPSVHSFIIKLWFEQASEEANSTTWHGHITHVPGGERAYLKDLDEVAAFITPYLKAGGVRLRMSGRLAHWFRRLRPSARRN